MTEKTDPLLPAMAVARRICELSHWQVSNLKLQKLLYLSQLLFIRESKGGRLICEDFYAWRHGPVIPQVFYAFRRLKHLPIEKSSMEGIKKTVFSDRVERFLKETCDFYYEYPSWSLVDVTHDKIGAWAKRYTRYGKRPVIAFSDILAEYGRRADSERA